MNGARCGCCDCLRGVTPVSALNRAGLSAITVRVGTHASFLETMLAELSSGSVPSVGALTTRNPADPAVAFLDAWATVADVLTFYQERIANEGYLRTATERRSLVELGRLVGYELRAGVAASTFLAYILQDDFITEIPPGSKVQSVPAPGEKPQTFETADPLRAHWMWNAIKARPSRPRRITLEGAVIYDINRVDFAGMATNLQPQDELLFVFATAQVMRIAKSVTIDYDANRTIVMLQEFSVVTHALIEGSQFTLAELDKHTPVLGPGLGEKQRFVPMLNDIIRWANIAGAAISRRELQLKLASIVVEIADQNLGFDLPAGNAFLKIKDDYLSLLEGLAGTPFPDDSDGTLPPSIDVHRLLGALLTPPSRQPAGARQLPRDVDAFTKERSEARFQVIQSLWPSVRDKIGAAFSNTVLEPQRSELEAVFALRETAAPFGYNAPLLTAVDPGDPPSTPAKIITQEQVVAPRDNDFRQLHLDTIYDKIEPQSWIVVRTPLPFVFPTSFTLFENTKIDASGVVVTSDAKALRTRVVQTAARTDYNLSSKVTRLSFDEAWRRNPLQKIPDDFQVIRESTVLVQSEPLQLAEELIEIDVFGNVIDLDRHYPGLKTGMWLIVVGERTDIPNTTGVIGREAVMIAAVEHKTPPGQTPLTVVTLANEGLAYRYKRSTVVINGNVVKATHGSTVEESLGNGDASKSMQQMTLKNSPLTFVAAPTPSGVASTLTVRADGVKWDETESFTGLDPTAHAYLTTISDDAQATVIFGNGKQGARLPTGVDNVKATYRVGIGRVGNLKGGQLTLAISRPLGTKDVNNPLPATGGADPETIHHARENIPVALLALDRLVSVQDYADFTRTFGGVTKASATSLPGGDLPLVHVTIAGDGDHEVDENSELFRNLAEALQTYGDPYQQVMIANCERIIAGLHAKVVIDSHYLWDNVEPVIRALLLDRFGFDRSVLGARLYASAITAAIQSVPGVVFVDLEPLRAVSRQSVFSGSAVSSGKMLQKFKHDFVDARLAHLAVTGEIQPAQLVYLTPDAPDLLALEEVKV